jgi:predicted phosphoribosyltransferase
LNEDVIRALPNANALIESVTTRELAELARREQIYRDGRPAPDIGGRTVILVDDGLATGATMRAAVAALRQLGAAKIVVAVPVGAADTCREIEREVDETVCAMAPEWFQAVGQFYEDFSQTSDDEVRELLARAARRD